MSKHDDLESLGYTLIFLLRGRLPWTGQDPGPSHGHHQYPHHLEAKRRLIEEAGGHDIPQEFIDYLRLVKVPDWNVDPNYSKLRNKFKQLFVRSGFRYDSVFDWTERRFEEMDGQ
jgi:hypothetical protein